LCFSIVGLPKGNSRYKSTKDDGLKKHRRQSR